MRLLRALLLVSSCSLVAAQTPVLTQGYDSARDRVDTTETTLTLANVNPATFGKLFSLPVDGLVYAQPLYVPGVEIPGQGTHNVLYVATMHDSVYAFDADGLSTQPLWHASFINPAAGITTEPASDNPSVTDTDGEVGILGTPVIDSSTGTLYVIAKTDETSGHTTNPCFRLHELDITTGAERTGSPTACIQTSVPGTGSPNSGGNVLFTSLLTLQRPGLALSGNDIYVAFGAWGDRIPFHGWVLAFDKSTLALVNKVNLSPNGTEGMAGIWQSGRGPAVDANGNLYVMTGNGGFDGATDYGDSVVKLDSTLHVTDYFTPYDQHVLDGGDLDLGTSGVTLLPDSAGTTAHPHIIVTCGKNGTIYVLDRDQLGQFNSGGDTKVIQEIYDAVGGTPINPNSSNYVANCYSGATYWRGQVYFGGISDSIKAFAFTNGLLSTTPASQTQEVYDAPGGFPVVSANGSTNGILWAIENAGPFDAASAGTAVLHAYDATNLVTELYNSSESPSDSAGPAVKFAIPTVANGKVYVGTRSSVVVYGLFSSMKPASTPVFTPGGGSFSGSVSVTISDASPGTTIYYTTDGSTPTDASRVYSGPVLLSTSATINAVAAGGGYLYSPDAAATYTITAAPATMTLPVTGSTLALNATTFTWTAGSSGTTGYYLWIGTSPGTYNLANFGEFTGTSATVNLPTTGATIYVRLWTQFNGSTLQYNDYTYTEASATTAVITTPAPGSTLALGSTTFTWTAGSSGTTGYYLWVGTSPGTYNLANLGEFTGTSATVNLPTTGATIYVRLWTQFNGSSLQYHDYTYTLATATPGAITSPAPNSTLPTGSVATFTWTAGSSGTTGYYLWIGTSLGTCNLANLGEFSGTGATVSLPTSGATIYVRLWTVFNGTNFQYNDYTYTLAAPTPGAIASPSPGSTLAAGPTTFTWSAGGSGTTGYYLWIGTSPGTYNLANLGEFSGTSTTVTLPTGGAPIYVRLWTVFNGSSLVYKDYTYTEATAAPGGITGSALGSTLIGESTASEWPSGSSGTSGYHLMAGTSPGIYNPASLGSQLESD
ncbi:MAG TPA: chitobiase/beta-hexosaminidase C-terminal domain-containing protein [Terracidiphilus sp.]|nr:chitobiase/beta-hexosaminidase C-terminal domain-containing protein [Terracidiphilus sp.]